MLENKIKYAALAVGGALASLVLNSGCIFPSSYSNPRDEYNYYRNHYNYRYEAPTASKAEIQQRQSFHAPAPKPQVPLEHRCNNYPR